MSLHVRNSFSPTSRSTQNSQDALPSSRPPTYNSFDDPQPVSSVTSRDNGSAYGDASLRNAVNGVLRDAGSPQGGTRSRLNHRQSMLTISARDPSALLDPRYLYYRVYTENGEMPSKHPINKKDPSLTRIRALSVAPPHTVASIKRCLCSIEKIGDYDGAKIFSDLSSEDPLEEGHVPLMAYEGPGATPEWPMVLVRPPLNQVIRVKHAWTPVSNASSKFLTIQARDILHTDGVIKTKTYSGRQQEVYKALNATGSRGYVLTSAVEFVT